MDKLPEKLVFSVDNITEYASAPATVHLTGVSESQSLQSRQNEALATTYRDAQPLFLFVTKDEVGWWRARLGKRVGFQPVDL